MLPILHRSDDARFTLAECTNPAKVPGAAALMVLMCLAMGANIGFSLYLFGYRKGRKANESNNAHSRGDLRTAASFKQSPLAGGTRALEVMQSGGGLLNYNPSQKSEEASGFGGANAVKGVPNSGRPRAAGGFPMAATPSQASGVPGQDEKQLLDNQGTAPIAQPADISPAGGSRRNGPSSTLNNLRSQ